MSPASVSFGFVVQIMWFPIMIKGGQFLSFSFIHFLEK
jgi:hypothetical protein